MLALPADQPGDLPAAFAALWRHAALPPLMQAGVMESAGVLRHHVLVHDGASQSPEVLVAARERLRTLAGSLGSSCQLLSINTGSGQGPPPGHPPWVDLLHGCLPGGGGGEAAQRVAVPAGGLGAWLSGADLSSLAAFVQELSVRCLLPHMETRLRALNTQVRRQQGGKGRLDSCPLYPPARLPARCMCLRTQCRASHPLTGDHQPQGPEEPAEKLAVAQDCQRRRWQRARHQCLWQRKWWWCWQWQRQCQWCCRRQLPCARQR